MATVPTSGLCVSRLLIQAAIVAKVNQAWTDMSVA